MSTVESPTPGTRIWSYLALLISAVGIAGSVGLSILLDLRACPLCFYQRTFVMGVFAILLVGLLTGDARPGLLSMLSLPLSIGGLYVAGTHVYLELIGNLECPKGFWNLGTAPQQSLALFVLLTVGLMLDIFANRYKTTLMFWGIFLGTGLGFLCVRSSPPLPPERTTPYLESEKLDTCRRPYRGPVQ